MELTYLPTLLTFVTASDMPRYQVSYRLHLHLLPSAHHGRNDVHTDVI